MPINVANAGRYADGTSFFVVMDIEPTESIMEEAVTNDVIAAVNRHRGVCDVGLSDFCDIYVSLPVGDSRTPYWWYSRALAKYTDKVLKNTKARSITDTHGVRYDNMVEYTLGSPFNLSFYVHVERSVG